MKEEFEKRGRKLKEKGEEQCTDMINMACQNVIEGSESEEFCEEFFFFTTELSDEELRRRKRLGLYTRKQ